MILLRLPPDLLARVEVAIASANQRRTEEEYNVQGWIRQAIEEKLAKLERGRRKKKKQRSEGNGQAGE